MKALLAATLVAILFAELAIGRVSTIAAATGQYPCDAQSTPAPRFVGVGQTTLLAFPHAPNPLRTAANVQSAPTVTGSDISLDPGQSVTVDGHEYKNGSSAKTTFHVIYASPKPAPTSATTPQPQPNIQNISDERVLNVGQSPLPLPSASPGSPETMASDATIVFPATALNPGTSTVLIGNGVTTCSYVVHVAPGPPKGGVLFTTGVGGSSLGLNTTTTVTPATPLPGASPGTYVYYTEKSQGQTFVPILASWRVTDAARPIQLYLTGGLQASASQGKGLYGISAGNDNFLVTLGWHSATVDMLQRGIAPNTPVVIPSGAPVTFASRTTRPFAALTFPLCSVASIFNVLGASTSCATPTPSPAPKTGGSAGS